MSAKTDGDALFQSLADPLVAAGAAQHGTMMGFPCLRADGKFFASLEPKTGRLIAKLPAERVNELVQSGEGASFAPNGRVFREWVAVGPENEPLWTQLLAEAFAFAQADG
ncbi:MAG: hypothetical protein O3B31_14080 [Chloroflexi bacterium]|nr:hypothetical protein [Chloroflexota bacterium]MDA1004449.1 hypothetical protein [Chloroflexota bacterium]